ncbi:MAG: phospholipase [Muribaculaceae bacterium]|nr:phospholipase [Muribaculaceae bacterium]
MIAAAIILAILIVGGALIYILDNGGRRKENTSTQEPTNNENETGESAENEVCCGMHITCEKDSLSTAASTEIIYYEDEELDAYANRSGEDYTQEEIEQFRDILLTLLPEDIAGWARSLQLRHIPLPPEVSDELLLIVREARDKSR